MRQPRAEGSMYAYNTNKLIQAFFIIMESVEIVCPVCVCVGGGGGGAC